MAVFESSEQLYGVITPFMEQVTTDAELQPKFVAGNTSFKVKYTDPDALFLLDCTVDPPVIYTDEEAEKRDAEVALVMSADDGHKFWLGQLNIPMALARRKVKVDGPVGKLLGLLPAITPAFGKYRPYAAEKGLPSK
ncbi:hypothetical protein AXA44_36740 [Rhodococcus sp. SC4]|nr:hypothetical protein AXA44_36740 [Rhodococcus sp. SC4]